MQFNVAATQAPLVRASEPGSDSDSFLRRLRSTLRNLAASFSSNAAGHIPTRYPQGSNSRVWIQAIQSSGGVFEVLQPGETGIVQDLGKRLQCLPPRTCLSIAPGHYIHSLQLHNKQAAFNFWVLTCSSAPRPNTPTAIQYVPVTEMRLSAPGNRHASGNAAHEWMSQAQHALMQHQHQIRSGPDNTVPNPVWVSQGAKEIPMALSLLAELNAAVDSGQVANPEQLDGCAAQALWRMTQRFGNRTLSALYFETALTLAGFHLSQMQAAAGTSRPNPIVAVMPKTLMAYRQPTDSMHCGVTALNAFFQEPVLTPGGAVDHLVGVYDSVYGFGHRRLDGLFGQRLLQAVRNNHSLLISREEFLGPNPGGECPDLEGICRDLCPADQWNTLLNFSFPDALSSQGPNSAQFKQKINQIQITPGLWLTAFSGLNIDQLVCLANDILAGKGSNPHLAHYPEKLEIYAVVSGELRAGSAVGQSVVREDLERELQNLNSYNRHGVLNPLPIICMSGAGGANSVNHYFSIMRDEHMRWINLDSMGTQYAGVQPCALFAEPGRLSEALVRSRVFRVVCPSLSITTTTQEGD